VMTSTPGHLVRISSDISCDIHTIKGFLGTLHKFQGKKGLARTMKFALKKDRHKVGDRKTVSAGLGLARYRAPTHIIGTLSRGQQVTKIPVGRLKPLPNVTGVPVPPGIYLIAPLRESATKTSSVEVTKTLMGPWNPLPIVTGVPVPPGIFLIASLPESATYTSPEEVTKTPNG
jgi:hypothetical protein